MGSLRVLRIIYLMKDGVGGIIVPYPIGVGHDNHFKLKQRIEFLQQTCKRDADGLFSFHNILVALCKDYISSRGKKRSSRSMSRSPPPPPPVAKVDAVETTGQIVEVTPQKDAETNLSVEQEAMISELVDSAKKG